MPWVRCENCGLRTSADSPRETDSDSDNDNDPCDKEINCAAPSCGKPVLLSRAKICKGCQETFCCLKCKGFESCAICIEKGIKNGPRLCRCCYFTCTSCLSHVCEDHITEQEHLHAYGPCIRCYHAYDPCVLFDIKYILF